MSVKPARSLLSIFLTTLALLLAGEALIIFAHARSRPLAGDIIALGWAAIIALFAAGSAYDAIEDLRRRIRELEEALRTDPQGRNK